MLFFSLKGNVNEPIVFKDTNGNPLLQLHVLPLDTEHANEHTIYCASVFDVRQIMFLLNQKYQDQIQVQVFDDSVIESAFKMPKKLGVHIDKNGDENQFGFNEFIDSCESGETKNVLFAQAFGNSFTDTYVSGNILREISQKFIDKGVKINYEGTLSQAFPQPGMILNQIHPLNSYFNSIFPVSELLRFDAYWSFSDIEMREGYEVSEYFEFFSKQFGLDEVIVRNDFHISPVSRIQINNRVRTLKEKHSKISLIQTNGTLQLHKMPDTVGKELVEALCAKHTDTLFISDNTYGLELDNLLNLSQVSGNLVHYVLLLENVDSVFTVSSLTPVLANELEVPCLFVSTMADGNDLFKVKDSIVKTISIKDHELYDIDNLYAPVTEEQLDSIWSGHSAQELASAFNELPSKNKKIEFNSDILTGNELVAKLMNPEF